MFRNIRIKWLTHFWYGINLVSQACHFPSIWEMINKESPKTLRSYVPNSKATCKPTMHASYSVTLFMQSKFSLTETGIYWPFGILELFPFHFRCYWQPIRNKASNAMLLHCWVLALSRKHPHLGRGILRILDCSMANLLGNRLWLGPWWPFIPQTQYRTRIATYVRPMLERNLSFRWQCNWSHIWWTSYSSSKFPSLFDRVHLDGLTCNPWISLALLGRESMDIPGSGELEHKGSTSSYEGHLELICPFYHCILLQELEQGITRVVNCAMKRVM